MLRRPALTNDTRFIVVDGEGVVATTAAGERVLRGDLYARLIPLLDGDRTADDIATALGSRYDPAEVFYALMQLEADGYIGETRNDGLPAAGGRRVRLHAPANVEVVEAESYLRVELGEINDRMLRDGRPWLLHQPWGGEVWIGPLIRPGHTACWRCLEHRLRRNRPFEYLRYARPRLLGGAAATSADPAGPAITMLAEAILDLENTLLLIDSRTGAARREHVARRPQCPACGDPSLYARSAEQPVELRAQRRRFSADGGYRVASPAETIVRFQPLVSPLLGVVSDVQSGRVGDRGAMQTCGAHYGFDPAHAEAPLLDAALRFASGKGMTADQAVASAMGEAIERYSCVFQGDEPRVTASYRDLGADAIHPNDVMQFSAAQYTDRESRNRASTRYQWIPRPLDPAERLEWTPVHSLTTSGRRYLPTMLLYAGYPAPREELPCRFDPNGNAAGNTIEEAILQGLLELVERDSLAIWWYNRLVRPAVDLAAANIAWCADLRQQYRSQDRELWVLDITTDLGIPAFAAASRVIEGPDEPLLGFGAHLDARIALTRALTEMNQIHGHVEGARQQGKTLERALEGWLREATIADQPWLAPQAGKAAPPHLDMPRSDDLADDIRLCLGQLAKCGIGAYVLDQTRPDIGVPVVKVVAPGLRHFRARHAPGRLFETPVKMGWLDAPRPESDMNPIAFFF